MSFLFKKIPYVCNNTYGIIISYLSNYRDSEIYYKTTLISKRLFDICKKKNMIEFCIKCSEKQIKYNMLPNGNKHGDFHIQYIYSYNASDLWGFLYNGIKHGIFKKRYNYSIGYNDDTSYLIISYFEKDELIFELIVLKNKIELFDCDGSKVIELVRRRDQNLYLAYKEQVF